jgi:hypothetical protein
MGKGNKGRTKKKKSMNRVGVSYLHFYPFQQKKSFSLLLMLQPSSLTCIIYFVSLQLEILEPYAIID